MRCGGTASQTSVCPGRWKLSHVLRNGCTPLTSQALHRPAYLMYVFKRPVLPGSHLSRQCCGICLHERHRISLALPANIQSTREKRLMRKQADMQERIQPKPWSLIRDGSPIADKAFFWNSLIHSTPNLICRNSLGTNSRTSIYSNGEFKTYSINVRSTQSVVYAVAGPDCYC